MLAMSSRAYFALDAEQKDILLKHYKKIIHSDLATIEKYGGGSARCMLSNYFNLQAQALFCLAFQLRLS